MKRAKDTEKPSLAAPEDEKAERPAGKVERLQKILASAGIASRRKAEEFILQGRVQVNGQLVTELGSKADPAHDHIRVDGNIRPADEYRYYMLNKPKQFVTTVSDPQGRPTVMQFFSRIKLRMFPVGRLDYHSEGLLLVTNDGELANALTRAASHVPKTYLVKVSGIPDENALNALRRGVSIPWAIPNRIPAIEDVKVACERRRLPFVCFGRAKTRGMKSPSPKVAIVSCEKCLKRSGTTLRKSAAWNTVRWCWTFHRVNQGIDGAGSAGAVPRSQADLVTRGRPAEFDKIEAAFWTTIPACQSRRRNSRARKPARPTAR